MAQAAQAARSPSLAGLLGISPPSLSTRVRGGWAILAAAVVLGIAGDVLFRAWPLGVNATLWLSLLSVATLTLPRIDAFDFPRARGTVWLVAAIGFSLMLVWRASPVLQTLDVLAVLLCLGMVSFRTTAGAIRKASNTDYLANVAVIAVQAVIGTGALIGRNLDWRPFTTQERSARVAALARGLAFAALPLIAFAALFASADVFFRDLLSGLLLITPSDVFSHVAICAVFGWVAGSYLWGALLAEREPLPETPRIPWLRFEFIETAVVFGLIDGLFLLFVGVQFRYFFGGADRVESSSSLTYSEYARRGFFELVAVAALVVPFLVLTHWLLPKAQSRLHRFYALAAGVLVLLVFVVMASALERMRLYQEEFGLTELRLYTTAFMVWLFAVLVWLALTVLRGARDRFAFGVVVAGLAVVIGLNAMNPDGVMISRNASINDDRPFDSAYALELSPDSVPALVSRFDEVPAAERCHVARVLRDRYLQLDADWREWNWSRQRAHDAVAASDALTLACE
jgi:hypothetical protein